MATAKFIDNSLFVANSATDWGGAVYVNDFSEGASEVAIRNSGFVLNGAGRSGGGIWAEPSAHLEISSTIFWSNDDDESASSETGQFGGGASYNLAFSLVDGLNNASGNGNFATDPILRKPGDGGDGWGVGDNDDYGDLHLAAGSPCVNTGDPAFVATNGELDLV